jgi:hypothetical protein
MEPVGGGATIMPWIGMIAPIATAIVTGFFAYKVGARKDASSTQEALHNGFKILIEELQRERAHLSERLQKAIDEGNVDLKDEIQSQFKVVEAKIEHNRRNADYNFQIINEIIAQQIEKATERAAAKRRENSRVVPQRLPSEKK